jgi:ABC-type uncharacterized transport system substrate-binding protein
LAAIARHITQHRPGFWTNRLDLDVSVTLNAQRPKPDEARLSDWIMMHDRKTTNALSAILWRLAAILGSMLGLSLPAVAHPHVWVTARSEIIYNREGRVTAVRHAWTFDEPYSAFAVQGLDKNGDGKLSADELAELAKVNVESLHEFDFFTVAKASGVKQDFSQPVDYALSYDKAQLTLTFTLPLRTATSQRTFSLEVFDPTWFVSFTLAEGDDAVRTVGAPRGCARTITRPRPLEPAQQQKLSEDFFTSLSGSNFGAGFVNRVLVACP